ncbi:MAG: hypothetical protein ACLQVN_04555 [Bryobacteraceae bacterium]
MATAVVPPPGRRRPARRWHADLLDMAEEVRQYYIPDFSSWKTGHDLYGQEFDKLIDALAAPEVLPPSPHTL